MAAPPSLPLLLSAPLDSVLSSGACSPRLAYGRLLVGVRAPIRAVGGDEPVVDVRHGLTSCRRGSMPTTPRGVRRDLSVLRCRPITSGGWYDAGAHAGESPFQRWSRYPSGLQEPRRVPTRRSNSRSSTSVSAATVTARRGHRSRVVSTWEDGPFVRERVTRPEVFVPLSVTGIQDTYSSGNATVAMFVMPRSIPRYFISRENVGFELRRTDGRGRALVTVPRSNVLYRGILRDQRRGGSGIRADGMDQRANTRTPVGPIAVVVGVSSEPASLHHDRTVAVVRLRRRGYHAPRGLAVSTFLTTPSRPRSMATSDALPRARARRFHRPSSTLATSCIRFRRFERRGDVSSQMRSAVHRATFQVFEAESPSEL